MPTGLLGLEDSEGPWALMVPVDTRRARQNVSATSRVGVCQGFTLGQSVCAMSPSPRKVLWAPRLLPADTASRTASGDSAPQSVRVEPGRLDDR